MIVISFKVSSNPTTNGPKLIAMINETTIEADASAIDGSIPSNDLAIPAAIRTAIDRSVSCRIRVKNKGTM